ncbi:hypothetical protein TTHERM_00933300 (macronuclear) [Tetrahymena thermophila SB210]|uniref:Uncharacterized protein n=1 Tax=Tetrahymena thermophila (strain SB210) TaxID=312017 RepID=I7MLC0_TETTS|nr:hypothetical protein TTHERM_00933300 [Tetrahymena thermophila SB210]EAS01641.1 hypothetical protein TTHERM_00933300 [Tetrahymena thermophila SB210]|eukprot:XP_001021886.1 hypothetical protein TTHERM_00933300 [Tetrahymena thermophila SB210]
MEKDYRGSTKFSEEQMNIYDVPYSYRDFCVDQYMTYLICVRQNPSIIENGLVYKIPFANSISSCNVLKKQWMDCQEYRENELYEEIRKVYLQQMKQAQAEAISEN